jgi:hypothetical protein
VEQLMMMQNRLIFRAVAQVALGILLLGGIGATLQAQSPLVFVTVDVAPPASPLTSKLVRFDSGVETFSVNAGASSAFQGVAPLGGNLLVADYINEAIQRFSPTGAYLGQFAAFTNPTFLESDNAGNVYTSHSALGPSDAVTRFNSLGVVTQTYGSGNSGSVRGIDADAAGNVYVAQSFGGSGSLSKYAANGTFLNSVALNFSPFDLSIDEIGQQLYLADGAIGGPGIRILDISGAMPSSIGSIATPAAERGVGIHYSPSSNTVLLTTETALGGHGLEYSLAGALLDEYAVADTIFMLDITTMPIPEPSSLALLMVGVVGVGLLGRRSIS